MAGRYLRGPAGFRSIRHPEKQKATCFPGSKTTLKEPKLPVKQPKFRKFITGKAPE
jgi:hypothetical protein